MTTTYESTDHDAYDSLRLLRRLNLIPAAHGHKHLIRRAVAALRNGISATTHLWRGNQHVVMYRAGSEHAPMAHATTAGTRSTPPMHTQSLSRRYIDRMYEFCVLTTLFSPHSQCYCQDHGDTDVRSRAGASSDARRRATAPPARTQPAAHATTHVDERPA